MKHARYLLPAALVLLLAGGAAFAWFQARKSAPASVPQASLQKIRIANIGLYSNFNIIAAKNGYFKENGLDAKVDEFDAGNTSIGALFDGKVDVAVAADFVGVSNIFKRKDLVILAEVAKHDVWNVLARKDKGINLPADLKGKTIGVSRKTAGEFNLGEFLAANGLKLEDVQLVDLTATDMLAKFQAGELDAIVTFEPHGFDMRRALGGTIIAWPTQERRKTITLVYALRPYVEAHPDVIEAYLRALVEADDFTAAHRDEARDIVERAMGYDRAYMDFILPKFIFRVELNQDLMLDMESQARWVIAQKLTDAEAVPNYLDYIWFDGLEKVRPQAVTIIH